jgi:hypothetical protein
MQNGTLTMRLATAGDAAAVGRLVDLEEARPLDGEVLVAELDGRVVATLSVPEDRAVADIFRPTAELVAMLRTRREQLARAPPRLPRRLGRAPARNPPTARRATSLGDRV